MRTEIQRLCNKKIMALLWFVSVISFISKNMKRTYQNYYV